MVHTLFRGLQVVEETEQTALWGVCSVDAVSCGVDDLSNTT